MMTQSFDVRVVNCDGHALVVGRGEIDMGSGPALRDALFAAQNEAADVIVDLSDVTFMDSTGINALIGAYRRRPTDGSLIVVGANSPVRRVFEITGFSELLMAEPQPLTWQQLTYHNSGWRQWITEDRTNDGVAVAEIIELGPHGNCGGSGAQYALEYQGKTTLLGSLEEAMRAAELLGSTPPHKQD
jgi:anti-sigma B factor antagonist